MNDCPVSPVDFDYLRGRVEQHAGIVLGPDKVYLVESRMRPLLTRLGFPTIARLTQELRLHPEGDLLHLIVEAMTTNETSFFRDMPVFDSLREVVLPHLIKARAATKQLNIWCAASSSGQEPYSMLMLLRESFPQLTSWRVNYVASDISNAMLERTRAGIYSQHEVNRGLPARLLAKHFERRGLEWQVKPELRNALDLRKINLVEDWPRMPPMDLVMIRNVLIYFDADTKRRILARIGELMRPDGLLFLGTAETPHLFTDSFCRAEDAPCYRLATCHASIR